LNTTFIPNTGFIGFTELIIEVVNDCGSTTDTLTVEVLAIEQLIITGESEIMLGQSIELIVSGGSGSYDWTPSTGLDCDSCEIVNASPQETTTYIVSNDYQCSLDASHTVTVIIDDLILIPTAFSPNKDGTNDVFKIIASGIEELELHIYNRWGNEVFVGSGVDIFWDGTYKNEMQEIGVYCYFVRYKMMNSDQYIDQHGNVTLIK